MKNNERNNRDFNQEDNDTNIENTDKLDYAEINRRFREEQYFLNGQDPYKDSSYNENNYENEYKKEYKKQENRPLKPKKKKNFTPVLVFLTSLLVIVAVILVAWTLANNKRINNKLNDLDRLEETHINENNDETNSIITEDTEFTEETEDTEETEETEETEPSTEEEISGNLTQDLNFRSGPGYEYDVIGTIPAGTSVDGVMENGWLKVEYNGQIGYIGPKYVQ
ncbi:MAG: SH3 domain-containing protein [Lagierella massiliensis]|nr:SH3 domain-containing protein [Lagierella massiliensis]